MSISFKQSILPLFRSKDIICMGNFSILLNDYEYMSNSVGDNLHSDHANARHVLGHLKGDEKPRMPPDGPYWSESNLKLLKDWIDEGCLP